MVSGLPPHDRDINTRGKTHPCRVEQLFDWQNQQLKDKKLYLKKIDDIGYINVYQSEFNAAIRPTGNEYDHDVWDYCKMTLTREELDYLKTRARSPTNLSLVREQILKFNDGIAKLPQDDDTFWKAYNFVRQQWQQYTVKPMSLDDTERFITASSSAGFLGAGYSKGECFKVAKRRAAILSDRLIKGLPNTAWPCQIATRPGLVNRGEVKARGVWVYPYHMTLLECQYAEPIIQALNAQPTWLGWTVRWMDGYADTLTNLFGDLRCTAFGADYSGFDYTQHSRRIDQSFMILKGMFDVSSMSKESRRKFNVEWNEIVRYYKNTPMLLGNKVYLKHSGTPSGSYFTQLVDSVYNMLALCDCILRVGIDLDSERSTVSSWLKYLFVLGDDSIALIDDSWCDIQRDRLITLLRERHNLVWHPHKGFWRGVNGDNQVMEFLGHHFTSGSGPTRPFITVVEHALYPERVHDDPGIKKTVAIGLAWMTSPCQRRHINWLYGLFTFLQRRYPSSPPGDWPLWMLRQFKFGLMNIPKVQMPTLDQLLGLYQKHYCDTPKVKWYDDQIDSFVYW